MTDLIQTLEDFFNVSTANQINKEQLQDQWVALKALLAKPQLDQDAINNFFTLMDHDFNITPGSLPKNINADKKPISFPRDQISKQEHHGSHSNLLNNNGPCIQKQNSYSYFSQSNLPSEPKALQRATSSINHDRQHFGSNNTGNYTQNIYQTSESANQNQATTIQKTNQDYNEHSISSRTISNAAHSSSYSLSGSSSLQRTSQFTNQQQHSKDDSFNSGTKQLFDPIPSLDYISKIMNKSYYMISNYTLYSDQVVGQLGLSNNTLLTSVIIQYYLHLLSDRTSLLPLSNIYDKVICKKVKIPSPDGSDRLQKSLFNGLKALINEKISNMDKGKDNHQFFLDLFLGDHDLRESLVTLLRQMLIEYIESLDAKTYKFVFSGEHKQKEDIINLIKGCDSEPMEEIISIIPSVLDKNIEIHYLKDNKIEIVLYRQRSFGSKSKKNDEFETNNEPISFLCVEKNGKQRYSPLINSNKCPDIMKYVAVPETTPAKEVILNGGNKSTTNTKEFNNIKESPKANNISLTPTTSTHTRSATQYDLPPTSQSSQQNTSIIDLQQGNGPISSRAKSQAPPTPTNKSCENIVQEDVLSNLKFDPSHLITRAKNFSSDLHGRTISLISKFITKKKPLQRANTTNIQPYAQKDESIYKYHSPLTPSNNPFDNSAALNSNLSYQTNNDQSKKQFFKQNSVPSDVLTNTLNSNNNTLAQYTTNYKANQQDISIQNTINNTNTTSYASRYDMPKTPTRDKSFNQNIVAAITNHYSNQQYPVSPYRNKEQIYSKENIYTPAQAVMNSDQPKSPLKTYIGEAYSPYRQKQAEPAKEVTYLNSNDPYSKYNFRKSPNTNRIIIEER